jgi:hypothetical protein
VVPFLAHQELSTSESMVKRMRLLTLRFCLAAMLLSVAAFVTGQAQEPPVAAGAGQTAADPILGWWKLNVEKSTNPIAESELIFIAEQGNQFQIVFQAMQSNKYNPHYQITTDMKGTTAKPVQVDGRPMNDEWRVTRNTPNAFVVEGVGSSGGWRNEYAVSANGKRLTVRELPGTSRIVAGKIDANGVMHPIQHVLVFEKIPDSEGQALSKVMSDTDAAQKAEAAKKSAEQAALDAVACSLATSQGRDGTSGGKQTVWREYVCPKDGFGISLPNAPEKQSLQNSNFYKLFMTEDESIVAQLWVSAEPIDCAGWIQEMQKIVNKPVPPGTISATRETTFQGNPAFEDIDRHTNGPQYVLYDVTECTANKTYNFHARWLSDQSKPQEVTRIFDSFKLVTKENSQ